MDKSQKAEHKLSWPALLMILFLFPQFQFFAEDTPLEQSPRIALVLGGGGALGFAHVGVILALEEAGIDPDIVVGTSIGSIVGGLYSAGYTPDELKRLVIDSDWQEILFDNYNRDKLAFEQRLLRTAFPVVLPFHKQTSITDAGISQAQHVVEFLDYLFADYSEEIDFSTLPREFRAVAADLVTGDKIVFDNGDLKTVIRASMAVPGIFSPVFYRGHYLIDGGWVDNVPVTTAVEMGADIIITVPLTGIQSDPEKLKTISSVSQQATAMLLVDAYGSDEEASDLVIRPDLSGYTMADFEKGAELIELGYAAGKAALPRLRKIAPRVPEKTQRRITPHSNTNIHITKIQLAVDDKYNKEILALLRNTVPQVVSSKELRTVFSNMYDTGNFKRCWYRLIPQDSGSYILEADIESILLPDSLIGLSFEFEGYVLNNTLNRGAVNMAYIKPFGEKRLTGVMGFLRIAEASDVRLGILSTPGNNLLISAFGYFEQRPVYYYDKDTLQSYYSLNRLGGDLLFTVSLGTFFGISLQPHWDYRVFNRRFGADLDLHEQWTSLGNKFRIQVDTLDNPVNPESGIALTMSVETAIEDDQTVNILKFEAENFFPLGHSGIFTPQFESAILLNGNLMEGEQFYPGENKNFHGYLPQEIRTENFAAAGLRYRQKIGRLPLLIGKNIYLQLTINSAADWTSDVSFETLEPQWYHGGSAGIVADFPIGEFSLRFEMNKDLRPNIFIGLSSVTSPVFRD